MSSGALGPPRGPKRFRTRFSVHFGSILGCLWEPLGHPSEDLFCPFGRPEGPRSKKNDASEDVCSRARFFTGFSSLSGCLGPLRTWIPYGRVIQNRIFDRDRKNHDFGLGPPPGTTPRNPPGPPPRSAWGKGREGASLSITTSFRCRCGGRSLSLSMSLSIAMS